MLVLGIFLVLHPMQTIFNLPMRLWIMKHSDVDRISIGYAINCPQCMGIWIGFSVGILFYQVSPSLLFLTAMTFGTSLLAVVADRYLLS